MKIYRIGYTYTEHGSVSVLARTEDQAALLLNNYLEVSGLEDIDSVFAEYETHHREYEVHKEHK